MDASGRESVEPMHLVRGLSLLDATMDRDRVDDRLGHFSLSPQSPAALVARPVGFWWHGPWPEC